MTDLLAWAAQFTLPHRAEGQRRKVRFTRETLPLPKEFHTASMRVVPGWRRPGGDAIVIDCAVITTAREGYRALGLALLGYALSEQVVPLRIHLPGGEKDVRQIIVWPGTASKLEIDLRCRLGVRELHYRPRPFYQRDPADHGAVYEDVFPREHLPFCTLGAPGWVRGGPPLVPGDPWCLHVAGTSPSHVWLGRYLLDLSFTEGDGREWYLYNTTPAEQMARGSAELRLVLADRPEPVGSGGDPAD
ncbi:hypothetical protein [Longimicrobium sp.]|uniref:hypothetical protein n=1 Tax=Longimicrobium sp. TaxID=2029185 RepID=UPI003B3AD0CE